MGSSAEEYAAFEEKVKRTVYIDNLSPQCALVVMQMEKQAKAIICEMNNFPFMMSGMPRPVRALAAEVKMFADRPIKPGRRITCQWLDPSDRNFDVAQKLKQVTQRHAKEASYLLQLQLEEEEKLAAEQSETLKTNYKKCEMLENLFSDGSHGRLAYRYNLKVADD
ncbi:hypothetical protein MKX01_031021 [Papaver californicum]|nr:hypothetical protein MKX01_031021 [Papaver californicum]